MPGYFSHGVNKRTPHKSSGDGLTLLKTLVVSLLVHATVIYLIPPVDLLPQPASQYFEIETVTIEPEEHNVWPADEHSSEQQMTQSPDNSEPVQESVTPLSDYEPMTPRIISEERESLYEQFLIPQQHFTLPETLESVNVVVVSPQKPAVPPEPAALDVAILPARTFSKTAAETSVPETHPGQERMQDTVVIAEQPYERAVAPVVPVVAQEPLPDLKRSQVSEAAEQTSIPSLSTKPVMKRTTGSDLSVPVRPPLPNIQASPERPPLRISEAKALPQHLPAEEEYPPSLPEITTGTETRVVTLSTETEPEFRPAQSVLLPTSHSQDVIDVSEPALRSVHLPAIVAEYPVLRPDPPSVYVRSEEKLLDNKALPVMMPDQVVQRAESIERSVSQETEPFETHPELQQDNALSQITPPVMAQASSAAQYIYFPAQLTKSPRQVEMLAEGIEQKPADIRQSKLPIQEEHFSQKMLPSFQTFSSLPAIHIAKQPSQPDRMVSAEEEAIFEGIPRPELSDIALFAEPEQFSAFPVMAFPRSSQALSPQNLLASPAFIPPISSEKTVTTIEETFRRKEMAEDIQQPGMMLIRPPQKAEQQAREQESETLQKPQKLISPPDRALSVTPGQTPAFKPAQRSLVVGAETASNVLPAKPVSFGIFVKKDRPVPEAKSPQNPIQMDDALHQIRTDALEEGTGSLTIEGPASMRQVISRPLRLPDIDLDVEVTIRLKFWVLPDGSVGEVVPLQRGDIRLERAAIQYLKSWRFTPLSSGNQTVWGIIPITYKLR